MFIHLGISLKGMTVFAQVPVEVLGSTTRIQKLYDRCLDQHPLFANDPQK